MSRRRQIERDIISVLLYQSEKLNGQRSRIKPEFFEDSFYRKILEIIYSLIDENIKPNVVNVVTKGKLSNEEAIALTEIEQQAASLSLLSRALTEEVLNKKITELATALISGKDVFDKLELLRVCDNYATELISSHTQKTKTDLIDEFKTFVQKNQSGSSKITTGIASLDMMLNGGLGLSEYSILGGSPGSGKTSLLLSIALSAARSGVRVGFIEGEMSSNEIFSRLAGIISGEDCNLLSNGYEPDLMASALAEIEQLPLEFVFCSERTLRRLEEAIRSLVAKGCQLVFADYLQVFSTKTGKASDEFAEIKKTSEIIRGLALRHNIHLMAVSSLNRHEFRESKPSLVSFYGSSFLGYDASLAMIVSDVPDEGLSEMRKSDRSLTLYVLKNRNGCKGALNLVFNLPSQRIYEISSEPF